MKAPVHDSSLKSYFNSGFSWWQGQWKGKEKRTKVEIRTVLVNRLLFKYIHMFTYIRYPSLQKVKK